MSPLSLSELERAGYAQADDRHQRLLVRVPTDWPAEGEKRIGYVSILRLVESARELHWRRDVAPYADLARLDSITKAVTAEFVRPVMADTQVVCDYELIWIRPRSYGLRVTLADDDGDTLARIELTSVFVDPGTLRPVAPEPRTTEALKLRLAERQPVPA